MFISKIRWLTQLKQKYAPTRSMLLIHIYNVTDKLIKYKQLLGPMSIEALM